jgi:ABC-type Zn uptake system ZnuABC Zn-binding protein ZnuA
MKTKTAIWLWILLITCPAVFASSDHHEDHQIRYEGPIETISGKKIKVVATTTTFASLVREIGGNHVDVKSVSLPKFNTHYFQPKFSDVRNVQRADVFVQAGLDHELWTQAILEAAGKPKLFRGAERNIPMSDGIRLLDVPESELSRSAGDVHIFGNPHIWMNPENARIMADNLRKSLKGLNPKNAADYDKNTDAFLKKLDMKINEWNSEATHVRGKEVVSYHKDIIYFADFMGFQALRYYEPKPGIPPSPKELMDLQQYIKDRKIKAIIQPVYYSRSSTDALAKQTGAKVYIICQNAGEVPGTEDYISLFDYNVKTLSEALK